MIRKWPEECELNCPIIICMLEFKQKKERLKKKKVTNVYYTMDTIA